MWTPFNGSTLLTNLGDPFNGPKLSHKIAIHTSIVSKIFNRSAKLPQMAVRRFLLRKSKTHNFLLPFMSDGQISITVTDCL